jgi:hypothetical protein
MIQSTNNFVFSRVFKALSLLYSYELQYPSQGKVDVEALGRTVLVRPQYL